VTLSIAAPGELTAVQDPAEMTRGLRFSLVPGSPISPMESPMLQKLKAVEEQAAEEAAGSEEEEEDDEVQPDLVEEQAAARIIEDNQKAEQAEQKKKLEETKAKEMKQSAPAQRVAPNGSKPALTKQSTLSLNGHAKSSSQRPSTIMVGSPTIEYAAPMDNNCKEFSILRYKGVVPTYMECWLEKRGPTDTYKWMKRWFVFYEDRIEYFKDVERKEAKGDVRIKPCSRIIAFREKDLPGDAVKYKSNKPFGFVLDPDPSAGKQRRMHYFDAGSDEVLRSVLSNFQKACEGHEARIREVSKFILNSVYVKA